MSILEIILYLRTQLLELRGENDRQAISELLSTFKMLTKIAYENADRRLIAVLVDLTDVARDLYMGQPPGKTVPTENTIRKAVAATKTAVVAMGGGMGVGAVPNGVVNTLPTEAKAIEKITTQEIEQLETSFNQEADIQGRLRRVIARNWRNYAHIRDGSERQMQAYSVVYDDLLLFRRLADHDPIWVGTYPIDLDVETSDIDIICNPDSLRPFLLQVKELYGEQDGFRLTWKAIDKVPTVLARFHCGSFNIELFAQPRPTSNQNAFVHMLVEARLLAIGGPDAREGIRQLKAEGMATEPAFIEYFQINTEDPYAELLSYARLDNDTLRRRIGIEV